MEMPMPARAPQSRLSSRRRRTQQERREDTRHALLEGMMQALIEVGYARATTSEITRRAGLSTGALQHHFASKEELVLAVVQHHFDGMLAQVEAFAKSDEGAGDDAWTSYVALLADVYTGERYMAVWEVILGTRGDRALHAAVIQHRVQSLGILETLWSRVFERRIANKRKRTDLMHFTMAVLRGFVFYNVIAPDPKFLSRQREILFALLEGEMQGDDMPVASPARKAPPARRTGRGRSTSEP
jgi:AcrR family transcriptional regulator